MVRPYILKRDIRVLLLLRDLAPQDIVNGDPNLTIDMIYDAKKRAKRYKKVYNKYIGVTDGKER